MTVLKIFFNQQHRKNKKKLSNNKEFALKIFEKGIF